MRGNVQRAARPVQTRLQNSGATGPKFIKFLSDVKGSSMMLTHASMFRLSYPLWNAIGQNEDGVYQFSPIRAKIGYHSNGYHSNAPRAIAKRSRVDDAQPYLYSILKIW